MPSEWLALDLGAGELAAMALALENPSRVILLDDALARRTAQAAGLVVWGTLKILLEAKSRGITQSVGPWVDKLADAGMWLSGEGRIDHPAYDVVIYECGDSGGEVYLHPGDRAHLPQVTFESTLYAPGNPGKQYPPARLDRIRLTSCSIADDSSRRSMYVAHEEG